MRSNRRGTPLPPLLLCLSISALLCSCSSISGRLVAWKKGSYRSEARLTEHRISVAGHEVVYLDRGAQGTSETMLLLHGFGADKDNWTFFAKHIPDTYRVIALDLPGFGESSRNPSESYDVRAQSARLLAFVDALSLSRFHLAGNSMGGNIAARFALDHPERVASLALLDSSGVRAPNLSEVGRELEAGRNPLVVNSPADFDRMIGLSFVTPPAIPGFVKQYFAERAFANRDFNLKIFADMTAHPDRLETELPNIKVPTLIIWGDHDRIIDVSAASVFQSGIHGAQTVVIPNCGHAPMIEHPVKTARAYLSFLSSLPAPSQVH